MEDQKLTALTEDTSPALTDLCYTVKNPGGTPLSRKALWSTIKTLFGIPTIDSERASGYMSISSCAYASSTTVTVASGATTKYAVGDKFKYTQLLTQAYTNDPASGSSITLNMTDTTYAHVGNVVYISSSAGAEQARITAIVANTSITVDALTLNHTTTSPLVTFGSNAAGDKYGYITDIADTTLTISSGNDYQVEDASMTAYYSHGLAYGFPDWFRYTTTRAVSGGTAPTYTAIDKTEFKIDGLSVDVHLLWKNTTGGVAGSGGGALTFTLPVDGDFLDPSFAAAFEVIGHGESYESADIIKLVYVSPVAADKAEFVIQEVSAINGNGQSSTARFISANIRYRMAR